MKFNNFHFIAFYMFFTSSAGCSSTNKDYLAQERSEIVIILTAYKAPIDTYELKKGVLYKTLDPELSFFDGSRRFPLDVEKQHELSDTLKIKPNNSNITLLIRANPFITFDYFLNAGDTLEVSTSADRLPIVKIINRATWRFDQSFDSLWFKKTEHPGMSALAMAQNSDLFVDYSKSLAEINTQRVYLKRVYSQLANEEINRMQETADSLKGIRQLSPETHSYITNKNRFNLLSLELPASEIRMKDQLSQINNDSVVQSFVSNIYFYSYLDKLSDKLFSEKAQHIDFKDGVNRDYCQIFDTIAQSTLLAKSIRQYLLSREMKRVINSFSPEVYLTYFDKFKEISNDSILIQDLKKNYFLTETAEIKESKTVTLSSAGQQATTLDKLLASNKGFVIYIDFWASWCMPCRESMKHALSLQEKYKGKKFKIIFLSIDKNAESWTKAARVEGINKNANSYIVKNYPIATFFKTVNLISIPRYMLYDKSGKLLFTEASDPGSAFLQQQIEAQINK